MQIKPALLIPTEAQIQLFNACFEGYLAGFSPLDLNSFGGLLRSGGIDLSRSLIGVEPSGQPSCVAYVTVFAGRTRLAAMGVRPEYRRKGCAETLLEEFIYQVKQRGHCVATLEVFEQNIPAVHLYKKHGFKVVQRLFGYCWNPGQLPELFQPEQATLPEMLCSLPGELGGDAPYQFSLYGLIPASGGMRINRHRNAWIVYELKGGNDLHLKYLADGKKDYKCMKQLVSAVGGLHPDRQWSVPQLVPEEISLNVLEPLGFEKLELNQLQMILHV